MQKHWHKHWDVFKNCLSKASEFKGKKDWHRGHSRSYTAARYNGWLEDIAFQNNWNNSRYHGKKYSVLKQGWCINQVDMLKKRQV